VIGFGDVPTDRYLSPSLTTVRIPVAELAAAGVRRALDILGGRDSELRVRMHPVELVIRESTAAPSLPATPGVPAKAASRGGRGRVKERGTLGPGETPLPQPAIVPR
jgi:hypothetical protein